MTVLLELLDILVAYYGTCRSKWCGSTDIGGWNRKSWIVGEYRVTFGIVVPGMVYSDPPLRWQRGGGSGSTPLELLPCLSLYFTLSVRVLPSAHPVLCSHHPSRHRMSSASPKIEITYIGFLGIPLPSTPLHRTTYLRSPRGSSDYASD